jgi:catechol 2,3-dioxygenase-like lactoylglutathione lyase family enzyme
MNSGIRLHHVMLYVSDVARSVAFYETLGLQTVESDHDYARLTFPGGGDLALHPSGGEALGSPGARLYLEVQDVDETFEGLVSAGIEFEGPPKSMEWGWRHVYLLDPDGHQLSLFTAA